MSYTQNTTTEKKRYGILLETKMPLTPFRALEAYKSLAALMGKDDISRYSLSASEKLASSTKRGESL